MSAPVPFRGGSYALTRTTDSGKVQFATKFSTPTRICWTSISGLALTFDTQAAAVIGAKGMGPVDILPLAQAVKANREREEGKEEKALTWHFDEGTGNMPEPLCHATDKTGRGYAKTHYTKDPAKVTCKRCLKSLAVMLAELEAL